MEILLTSVTTLSTDHTLQTAMKRMRSIDSFPPPQLKIFCLLKINGGAVINFLKQLAKGES